MSIKDKQWCDWSELYKTGKNLEPEHPLSQPLKKGSTGGEQTQETAKTLVQDIINGFRADGVRQPTDEELFGHLVKTEEEIEEIKKAAKKKFDETLYAYNDWQPAKIVKKHNFDPNSWGNCRPILDKKEIEELKKYHSDRIKNGRIDGE